MAFDGVYPRQVREAGVVHRIFVHRARCGRCGFGDALLPSFVVRRRRDSDFAVGAAVLERCGVDLPAEAPLLYAGTPARTVRSWRQRFSGQADDLSVRFSALCAQWGGHLPWVIPKDPSARAAVAMGAAWQARRRQARWGLPGAWLVANVVLGGTIPRTMQPLLCV